MTMFDITDGGVLFPCPVGFGVQYLKTEARNLPPLLITNLMFLIIFIQL